MGLKEQLKNDYKEAMKNSDTIRKDTVNMVRAAIKQQEIDSREEINDDADIVRIIRKQVKMRTDALADFARGGRDDIVESYTKEIDILKSYLPEEMTNEAIAEKVKEVAEKLGITEGMKNMGILMKNVMAEIKDAADGSTVNKIVNAYLKGDFDKEDKE